MALDTKAGLAASIADWLKDASLTAKAADFITLAEARLNRKLRHPDMEAADTITASAETADYPAGFLAMKALWLDGYPDSPLTETSLANLKAWFGSRTGTPTHYAVAGRKLYFAPIPASAVTLQAIFYQKLDGLAADGDTNWLLADHPDVYLFACLTMAELRGWNDERLPMLKSAYDEAIGEISAAGVKKQWGSAPIKPLGGARQTRGARI